MIFNVHLDLFPLGNVCNIIFHLCGESMIPQMMNQIPDAGHALS